jgi:hypothetical protein
MPQGFMSYMMDHPNNLSKNAHVVGQLRQIDNNPVDIESEDAQEDHENNTKSSK